MVKRSLAAVTSAAVLLLGACGGSGMAGHDMTPAPPADSSTSAAAAAFNDADAMFVQMMIPHHEDAVVMSDMLLAKTGVDPEVRQLAEHIKSEQQPEIEQMRGLLQTWTESGGVHTHGEHADHGDGGMMTPEQLRALDKADAAEGQKLFLSGMIAHHKGATAMAKTEIADGKHPAAVALAEQIVATQQAEIETMKRLLAG